MSIMSIALVIGVHLYLGVALGYFFSARDRLKAARKASLGGLSEDGWLDKHAMHLRRPSYHEKPKPSLRDYYAYDRTEGVEAVATVDYYRRTLLCPVWPVMLVFDSLTRYRQAKEASAPYLLSQQQKKLREAQEYSERLVKAQHEAQAAIDELSHNREGK